jgi:hypothetical protein
MGKLSLEDVDKILPPIDEKAISRLTDELNDIIKNQNDTISTYQTKSLSVIAITMAFIGIGVSATVGFGIKLYELDISIVSSYKDAITSALFLSFISLFISIMHGFVNSTSSYRYFDFEEKTLDYFRNLPYEKGLSVYLILEKITRIIFKKVALALMFRSVRMQHSYFVIGFSAIMPLPFVIYSLLEGSGQLIYLRIFNVIIFCSLIFAHLVDRYIFYKEMNKVVSEINELMSLLKPEVKLDELPWHAQKYLDLVNKFIIKAGRESN